MSDVPIKTTRSIERKLKDLILKVSERNLSVFSNHIKIGIDSARNSKEDIINAAKKAYNDAVLNDVTRSFSSGSSDVLSRAVQLLFSPSLSGYPSRPDYKTGVTGGVLYASFFCAITHRPADAYICKQIDAQQSSMIEHYQNHLFPSLSRTDTQPIQYETLLIGQPVIDSYPLTPEVVKHASLSPVDESPSNFGSYHVYGKDIALERLEKVTPPRGSSYAIRNQTPTASAPIPPYTYSSTQTQKKKSSSPIKVILIILAIIVGVSIATNLLEESEPGLDPVAEPQSGAILTGSEDLSGSKITVAASSGESCVVKLKTGSGTTRLSFYVRAGDTVTIGVPREYLYVYFASGNTWYGQYHLFGENTSYSMDDGVCDFSEYTWKYTLYPVSSGNFSQTPIDAEEF